MSSTSKAQTLMGILVLHIPLCNEMFGAFVAVTTERSRTLGRDSEASARDPASLCGSLSLDCGESGT